MRRYLLPVSVSLLFIAWSPFIGPLRDVIKRVLGDAFTPVIGLGVGLTVLAAVGWGVRHVRERRLQRVGLMSLAVLLFVGYAAVMRTGVPDVDAVERIHFVEYGLVATLFYRAMAGMPLRLVVPLTLLIGVLVGIGEEWLQWLVPTRVGDVRDVFLNLYALGCGLLFAIGLYPPQTPAGAPLGVPWQGVLRLASIVVLSFAGFLHCAHLGYELTDPALGRFRSFFTFEQLAVFGAERTERWRLDPPAAPEPFAIQDHFFFEAAAHIQHRNESYERGQFRDAWLENALLERYYPSLLDQRAIGYDHVHRWPPATRDDAESNAAGTADGTYVSPVYEDRVIVAPSKTVLWSIAVVLAGVLLAAASVPRRRRT